MKTLIGDLKQDKHSDDTRIKEDRINPDAIDEALVIKSYFPKSTSENVPYTSATKAIQPKIVDTITTCATCGSLLGGKPLVKEGLFPQSLSDIIPPLPAIPQAAKWKLVAEARVIPTYDFCMKLEEKDKRGENNTVGS
ncbi:hypothetical protein CHS0354_004575 [Potamilus streckersoni]|uniref:Uncharacterized protein n=1 Tax=Potamilus streckersoni TaxID=2493646 RepID=A0AAE0S588_9BIVA|nr:hypothetical protein CHS0354_004575 [Potamilus streckersoni]